MDEITKTVVERLGEAAEIAGFNRRRGGLARGLSWAEISGRHNDRTHWGELRVYHNADASLLTAAFIIYPSLIFGGGARVIGELAQAYEGDPSDAVEAIVSQATQWLEQGV